MVPILVIPRLVGKLTDNYSKSEISGRVDKEAQTL